MKQLSKEQIHNYLKNPHYCPVCESEDISSMHFDPEGAYQKVECDSCGAQWKEYFQMTTITLCET